LPAPSDIAAAFVENFPSLMAALWATLSVTFAAFALALILIAFLAAFFPILSNTVLGLKSADHNLIDLFHLYGAKRWQILWRLQLPGALPYLLGAMKIAGGLALIGAVAAEFVAGSGTATGLAWRCSPRWVSRSSPRGRRWNTPCSTNGMRAR
jgi:NitT/TauT family transport system permease protein